MNASAPVWRVSVIVPLAAAAAFEDALSLHVDAVSRLETADGKSARIDGFLPAAPDEDRIAVSLVAAAKAAAVPVPGVTVEPIQPRDWVMESLKTFPPVRAGRYFVHGSHIAGARRFGDVSIRMDAGPAFGTGTHESTSGCLALLDRLAMRGRPARVLDVGCGSGILGLAAAKTFFGARVLGFDIDPRAARIARENAQQNGCRSARVSFFVSSGYHHPSVRKGRGGGYDLVFANILARPLMRMAFGLVRNLAPGGVGILSGFLVRDERRVFAAHRMHGVALAGRVAKNGWVALAVRKRGKKRGRRPGREGNGSS